MSKYEMETYDACSQKQILLRVVAKLYWVDARERICESIGDLKLDVLVRDFLGNVTSFVTTKATCPMTIVNDSQLLCQEQLTFCYLWGFIGQKRKISGFQTLYCLAQCTPDLSPEDCRRCLSGVIGDLNWCCDGKQGGRVLYPSCNVRYELYPFYQTP